MFDQIRVNEYVCWNKKLKHKWWQLPEAPMWEGEGFDCIFQVTKSDPHREDPKIWLDCVKECGRHYFQTLTRDEYEDMSRSLGGDLLQYADSMERLVDIFAAVGDIDEEEKEEEEKQEGKYNLEADVEAILTMF
jgi:hypothetical protein